MAELTADRVWMRQRPAWLLPNMWWLVVPAILFIVLFFLIPVLSLFASSFDEASPGVLTFQGRLSWDNYERIFTRPLYYTAIFRSVWIGMAVSLICLVVGYPLAFVIARSMRPGVVTLLTILVLASMQLDMVIRLYGMMVLMGDRGLINSGLLALGLISEPLPLMYNAFGVILGLVQVTLPYMILSLIGTIRSIDPALEEAARSLGSSRWHVMRTITWPLSLPGVYAGTLLVFALAISSYVVPALMGGWKVITLPIHIYQQIAEVGRWQFGAAVAVVLFLTSLFAMALYILALRRNAGGRV
ncbi:ABC transporter permease [Celeribacter indicus]|uniref:ABC transporter permease n=1 Tax=Celeribacter indicus TaxID=1208324 RepID=A0A0B5DVJ5_9RHOB|nr:ABC transporter permease [Celeribacter indicus]AJE47039.1 ABC transporter permease [Celeribacter indicus]SDW92367.1 putative spermidine/putrescine transport system permease protein [Celeribacter indicus]